MNKKKQKIFIGMHYLHIGGAERSLLGLLEAINTNNVLVDLFLYHHIGELIKYIPQKINLLQEHKKYSSLLIPIKNVIKNGYIDLFITRLIIKIIDNLSYNERDNNTIFQKQSKYTTIFLPSLYHLGTYDLAISFLAPHNIVAQKVKAKKKIAWIHTDYSTIKVNVKMELPVWHSFDHIISISESVTQAFITTFPSLQSKIIEIENILPSEFIQQEAEKLIVDVEMPISKDQTNLLSIGRFSYAKNFDNIPQIMAFMIHFGFKGKWYIIGYGGEEQLIRNKIIEYQMEDYVIILGKKENPYPYIKQCNIYVQPSRYEGKAVTVREAQMLGKPVVITDFPTSKSQLINGTDGLILPLDNKTFAEGLYKFIQNKNLQNLFINNMKQRDYSNMDEIDKLYQLIDHCYE